MTRLLPLVLLLAACTAQPSAPDPGTPGPAAIPVPEYANWQSGWRVAPARDRRPGPHASADGGSTPSSGTSADVTIEGIASWVAPKWGRDYLAMRLPRGTRVTLSGPGGTWHAVVNDYGPARRTGRIADIAVGRWEDICAVPRSLGLCRVSAVITKRADIALPETDVAVEEATRP